MFDKLFQSKRGSEILEESERGNHGRFRDVFGRDWYLMVGLMQIQRGKNTFTMKRYREIMNVGQGVPIWFRNAI